MGAWQAAQLSLCRYLSLLLQLAAGSATVQLMQTDMVQEQQGHRLDGQDRTQLLVPTYLPAVKLSLS
jgi:hypothetical protein